jgi:hypothetical protein
MKTLMQPNCRSISAGILFLSISRAVAGDLSSPSQPCTEQPIQPTCPTCEFSWCVHVPRGTPHVIPDDFNNPKDPNGQFNRLVLVIRQDIPHWGILNSFEMGAYRNGQRIYDITLTNFGVSKNLESGNLQLQMELHDRNVDSLEANEYDVSATFHFDEIK